MVNVKSVMSKQAYSHSTVGTAEDDGKVVFGRYLIINKRPGYLNSSRD